MANAINVTITAKDLASGKIKGVGDQAKSSMDKLRGMRGSFLAVGAAGGAVVGALGLAIKSFAQTGDEIQKMAFRTALSTEVLSEYKFALEQSGSSIDGFEKAIKRMSSFVLDGRDGLATTTDALDRLGISVLDLEGLGVEDAFVLLSSALSNVEDDITQAALAQDVFGRAGTALLPLLAQGADGIAALREEARELGIVFTQDMADAAADVIDAQNTMKKSVLGLQMAFAEHLAPALSSTLETMGEVISKFTAFAEENPVLTKTIGFLALGLGTLLVTVGLLGIALPIMATGFGIAAGAGALFTVSLWAQVAAWIALNAATGGIIIAIGLVVAGIVLLIKNWDAVVRAVKIGINFMIGAIELWVNVHIKAFNKIIDGLNLVAGVFGKEIDQIAEVELPRFNTAMEEMAEVTEEETESVSKSFEKVTDSMRKELGEQARLMDGATQRVANQQKIAQKFAERARLDAYAEQQGKQKEADEREATEQQAVLDASIQRIADARKKQQDIWQATHDFRMELRDRDIANAERFEAELLQVEEAASAELIRIEQEEAKELVKIEKEKQDKLEDERALALANELDMAGRRMDAVEALREGNRIAFARIKSEVDLLPANLLVGGGSTAQRAGRMNVMQLFKNSQQAVLDDLKAARAALAAGQAGMLGGGTTVAMLEAEVAKLEGIEASGQFKGTGLGALLAPVGGYGTGGPPMIGESMKFREGVPGVVTIIFNDKTYGIEDLTDKINQGITEAAQRGALMPVWGEDF
jgi:Mg2+ and Co2+ transporter CorA